MKTSLKIIIWVCLMLFVSIFLMLEAIYIFAEDIPSVIQKFFYLAPFFIPAILIYSISWLRNSSITDTIDFLPTKSFLKVYFWTFIICLALMLEVLYVSGEYITAIWKNYYNVFPAILTWFIPFIITLLSYTIAYRTTRNIHLPEWDKRNHKTNLLILTGCLVIGGIWSWIVAIVSGWWIKGNIEYFTYMLVGCFLGALSLIFLITSLLYIWKASKLNNVSFKIYAAFYFSTLLLSSVFILCGIVGDIKGIRLDFFDEYLLFYILQITGITIILTLGILFNMWLTSHKKTFFFFANGVFSILILALDFIIIKEVIFYSSDFICYMRPQEYNEYDSSEFDYREEEEKDIIQAPVYEEDNLPDITEAFSFDFLWDNPEDNRDSIQSALGYIKEHLYLTEEWCTLTDIRNPDYFLSVQNKKGREAYLAIMQFLYDYRTHINLLSIANSYLPLLPTLIPYELYQKTGMKTTIRQLLIAHNDILEGTNDFERFAEIGKVMVENTKIYIKDEGFRERDRRFCLAIAAITNIEDYTEEFLYYDGIEHERIIWAYSFWARRYDEGIHQDVYTILRNIQIIYAE